MSPGFPLYKVPSFPLSISSMLKIASAEDIPGSTPHPLQTPRISPEKVLQKVICQFRLSGLDNTGSPPAKILGDEFSLPLSSSLSKTAHSLSLNLLLPIFDLDLYPV